jgi:acyl-CoA synthetase (NDP forming)
VVTGLLEQLGAIRVDDLDELLEISELLGHGRRPKGRRMMVITDSGGEANLVADHMRWFGLEPSPPSERLQRRLRERWPNFAYIGNPIDPWGVDPDYGTLYAEILAAMAEEDVDIVAVAIDKVTPWAGANEVDLGVAASSALIAAVEAGVSVGGDRRGSGERKFAAFITVNATGPAERSIRDLLRGARVPLMHGLRPALLAVARAAWWEAWPARTAVVSADAGERAAAARSALDAFADEGRILSERASREVLAAYGVPLAAGRAVATAEEAGDAAARLGFPVVMKGDVAGVAHKAAAGLVVTGVASEEQARRTFRTLVDRSREAGADPRGALVQATATGVELICGMRRDPVFGPVVLLGAGGTLTEILRDVAVRVAPLAPEDLGEMLAGCAAGRLLAGSGGDPAELFSALRALSDLAVDLPEIQEVDVNPLFVSEAGTAAAADALVVVERTDGEPES